MVDFRRRNKQNNKTKGTSNEEFTRVGGIWLYRKGADAKYRYYASISHTEHGSFAAFIDKPRNQGAKFDLVGTVYQKDEDDIDFESPVGVVFLYRSTTGTSHFIGTLVFQDEYGNDIEKIRITLWKPTEDEGKNYTFGGSLSVKNGDNDEETPKPRASQNTSSRTGTRSKPSPVEEEYEEESEDADDYEDDEETDEEEEGEEVEAEEDPKPTRSLRNSRTRPSGSKSTKTAQSTSATTKGKRGTTSRSDSSERRSNGSKPKGSRLAKETAFDY